jgi:hypothetical protein
VGLAGVPPNGGRAKAARCGLARHGVSAPRRPAVVLLPGLSAAPAVATELMGDFVLAGAWKTALWVAVFLVIGFNVLLLLQVAGLIHG